MLKSDGDTVHGAVPGCDPNDLKNFLYDAVSVPVVYVDQFPCFDLQERVSPGPGHEIKSEPVMRPVHNYEYVPRVPLVHESEHQYNRLGVVVLH